MDICSEPSLILALNRMFMLLHFTPIQDSLPRPKAGPVTKRDGKNVVCAQNEMACCFVNINLCCSKVFTVLIGEGLLIDVG